MTTSLSLAEIPITDFTVLFFLLICFGSALAFVVACSHMK